MSLTDGKSQHSRIFLALRDWPAGRLSTLDLHKACGSLAVSTKVSQLRNHKDFPADMRIVKTTEKVAGQEVYFYELKAIKKQEELW